MSRIVFIILISIGLISCQTEDKNQEISESSLNTPFEFKNFTNSNVGFYKDNELVFNVSNEKIVNTFNEFSDKFKLGLEAYNFKVITIENNKYLRFFNKDNTVSTVELIKDENNVYSTGSTVCTSTSCASGGGCVPNGVYCTQCQPYGPDSPITGDCVRTTTGGSNEL